MMRKSQENRTSANISRFRPIAWATAFFHPVSRDELQRELESARLEHAEDQRVLQASQALGQAVEKALWEANEGSHVQSGRVK